MIISLSLIDPEGCITAVTPDWTNFSIPSTKGKNASDAATTSSFVFKNFLESLDFVNKVGKIAENEGHHPDFSFGWGYVKINISTHAIEGLSENDFILAAKIDEETNA